MQFLLWLFIWGCDSAEGIFA